jgi:hypothetical protein
MEQVSYSNYQLCGSGIYYEFNNKIDQYQRISETKERILKQGKAQS